MPLVFVFHILSFFLVCFICKRVTSEIYYRTSQKVAKSLKLQKSNKRKKVQNSLQIRFYLKQFPENNRKSFKLTKVPNFRGHKRDTP